MLSIEDKEKGKEIEDSQKSSLSDKFNDYNFNINDKNIIKNDVIIKVKKEFLYNLREKKPEEKDIISINLKINFKIPGFYNIYEKIKEFIDKKQLSVKYRQDEIDIRKSEFHLITQSITQLRSDIKDFNEKINTELFSNPLINKANETKNTEKSYIEFIELFLNNYIHFIWIIFIAIIII